MERTWVISDLDGTNKRTVTLAQYRAEIEARKAMAAPIMAAVRRGDLKAASAAQEAMRNALDGAMTRDRTLADLLDRWNAATAPYGLRTDHEHKRYNQLARAIDNRMKRLGFRYAVDWRELSNGWRKVNSGIGSSIEASKETGLEESVSLGVSKVR